MRYIMRDLRKISSSTCFQVFPSLLLSFLHDSACGILVDTITMNYSFLSGIFSSTISIARIITLFASKDLQFFVFYPKLVFLEAIKHGFKILSLERHLFDIIYICDNWNQLNINASGKRIFLLVYY